MINKQKVQRNVGKILAIVATSAYLAGSNLPAQTASGSIDTISTDKSLTTDTKLSLDLNKNINLFARNRTTFDYQNGNKSPFTLLDLSYNWSNGLGILSETQFLNNQDPDQRFGLQYFKKIKNFSLYAEGTAGIVPKPNGEALIRFRYAQPIKHNLEGIAQIETITDFNGTGVIFATQRIKAGLGLGKHLEVGFESDFTELPIKKSIKTINTLGGYLTYKF